MVHVVFVMFFYLDALNLEIETAKKASHTYNLEIEAASKKHNYFVELKDDLDDFSGFLTSKKGAVIFCNL